MTAPTIETRLLKGSALAKPLRAEIAALKEVVAQRGGLPPTLATVLLGDDGAAISYRTSIQRAFDRVGIPHRPIELPIDITPQEFIETLAQLNADDTITGILVLTPLPTQIPHALVLEHLSPLKDVDGITPINSGRLHLGLPSLRPSTPYGGIELLDHFGIELRGAKVTVVGRSNVVGRPLATLLTQRDATVTLCHSRTRDLAAATRDADIVCLATGRAGLVSGDMVRAGAIVIDFGVNVLEDGSLVGDADAASMQGIAGAITPVPGGTGPVTSLVLARNTVIAGLAIVERSLDHALLPAPAELVAQHLAALSA